ncbi:Hypothetical predicted protein [Octopus vulgaris]|uniref:VWFD domain-containing protein n=1 Tax=Octopus vulgaris TaxID=6645 RepID=A0AA36BL40_OCTVU|nr:Hypothetical predicted protein [Octopus vulgaris]
MGMENEQKRQIATESIKDTTSDGLNRYRREIKYDSYLMNVAIPGTNEEFIKILGVSIRNHDLQRIHNVSVEDCLDKCRTLSYCNVMEYKKQHNKCDLSNVTYSKYPISVNYFGWDFYQKNPKKPPLKCNNCKCSASGDPHYRTFDGQLIHFMGTCKYTLARSLQSKGAGFFNVEVKNENRGNAKVSYTRMVDIILEGVRIRLLPKLKIRVNNRNVEAPVRNKKLGFTIRLSNRWIHVETSFNLRVSFDGKHRVRVSIPRKTFGGRMTGLCGDCNGHRDDLRTSNGTVVVHKKNKFSLIGESYRVTDDSDMPKLRCEEKDPNPDGECKLNGQKYCDIIRNPRGMFGKCIEKLGATDVREFYESCLYDYCFYANSTIIESIVCASLESFAAECESAGVVYNWRFLTNCLCGVEPIDIQFVVDISNSIREKGLYETKKFLTEFVNASIISSTQAQLGILLFNSKVSNKFFIDDAKTKEEIKDAIETKNIIPSDIFVLGSDNMV